MLVIDASVAVAASHSPIGLARLASHKLVAPHLMSAEAGSVLHEKVWRQEITPERGRVMMSRIVESPVELIAPDGLLEEAWAVAEELGWAKVCCAASPAFGSRSVHGRSEALLVFRLSRTLEGGIARDRRHDAGR